MNSWSEVSFKQDFGLLVECLGIWDFGRRTEAFILFVAIALVSCCIWFFSTWLVATNLISGGGFGALDFERAFLVDTLLVLMEVSGCESMGVTLGLIYVLFACFNDVSFVLVVRG